MFSINIKGKENPKTPQLVKLEAIFFKTGYARVSKVLNITGLLKDWDSKTQQFKAQSVDASEKNKLLIDLKTRYLKIAEEWDAEQCAWSPVQWSHYFDNEKKENETSKVISVCRMFEIIFEKMHKRERIKNGHVITSVGAANVYHWLRNTLTKFTAQHYNRNLSTYFFNDINEEFVNDFLLFLQKRAIERGNKGNIPNRLRTLRGVVYYTNKMSVPDADLSIFDNVIPKMKRTVTVLKTLPAALITEIETVDRSLFSRVKQLHIDLFLFSYYTGGMANVDVCFLTWNCIDENGQLQYERTKYPKTASIGFHPKARAIAEKYKDKSYKN